MQRQSLGGSPSSKLHLHGATEDKKKAIEEDDNNRNDISLEDEEAVKKVEKQQQRVEKSIHLIPILIFFCLLILYLSSYDPSQKDLAHIRRFNTKLSDELDMVVESHAIHKMLDLSVNKGGDMLGIRSQRGLLKHGVKPRSHRKLGDF